MSDFTSIFAEGQYVVRPPLFNRTGYTYWIARMESYLSSMDFDIWDMVEFGYTLPTIKVENLETPKPRDKWDINEKKLYTLNAKAMNAIICALDKIEYNRVSGCTVAKEIWHTLEVTHEGTSQVKESRMSLLCQEYENFKMEK